MAKAVKLFFGLLLLGFKTFSQEIPKEFKKPIVYISIKDENGDIKPSGTAFFIQVPFPNDSNRVFIYLVTAKHIIVNRKTNKLINNIIVKINTKEGQSVSEPLALFESGQSQNVYFHNDKSVDLAVIPLAPNQSKYDYDSYTLDMLINDREKYKNDYVTEGVNVFYTGLFIQYQGYKKINPIMRFGKVALIPEEKVQWDTGEDFSDLIFVETTTFGGNSGSPIFSLPSSTRIDGGVTIGGSPVKLIGIIKGYYKEDSAIGLVEASSKTPFYTTNVGITGVIPSYLLYEILFDQRLISLRNETLKKVKK
jgi:V8-like Glu-specific endopeptidase